MINTLFRYESEKKYRKQVKAQKLWFAILEAQTETGTPYILYKDACNRKSNQQVCAIVTFVFFYKCKLDIRYAGSLGSHQLDS